MVKFLKSFLERWFQAFEISLYLLRKTFAHYFVQSVIVSIFFRRTSLETRITELSASRPSLQRRRFRGASRDAIKQQRQKSVVGQRQRQTPFARLSADGRNRLPTFDDQRAVEQFRL